MQRKSQRTKKAQLESDMDSYDSEKLAVNSLISDMVWILWLSLSFPPYHFCRGRQMMADGCSYRARAQKIFSVGQEQYFLTS